MPTYPHDNLAPKADDVKAYNTNENQAPEDKHGEKYDNDASGWVRGAKGAPTMKDETAEGKPGFTHQSYRR